MTLHRINNSYDINPLSDGRHGFNNPPYQNQDCKPLPLFLLAKPSNVALFKTFTNNSTIKMFGSAHKYPNHRSWLCDRSVDDKKPCKETVVTIMERGHGEICLFNHQRNSKIICFTRIHQSFFKEDKGI